MSIKVYTTNKCGVCEEAKTFIKDKGFEYEEINVEDDKKLIEYVIQEAGQVLVPLLDVNGEVIVGFDRQKIEALLYIN